MTTGKRGRPRAFDEERALQGALKTFINKGLHDATLDDLAAEMGINKPSLYGAFGDKNSLFARVLRDYTTRIKARMAEAFDQEKSLDETLQILLDGAVEQFLPKTEDRMGCLVVSITSTAAGSDATLRAELAAFIKEADTLIEQLIAENFEEDLARRGQTPRQLALFLNNTAYALALRARVGASRRELRQCSAAMLDLVS